MNANRKEIDEAMLPFNEYIEHFDQAENYFADMDSGQTFFVEELTFSMPIQLDLISDSDHLQIGISPPLYYVPTTFEPVFHQIRLTLVKDENEQENDRK